MRWRTYFLSIVVVTLALPAAAPCESPQSAGVVLWPATPGGDSARPGVIGQLAFSPDGRLLAALRDGVVHLWDLKKREPVVLAQPSVPEARQDRVVSLAFSPDGMTLATASRWSTTRPARPEKYRRAVSCAWTAVEKWM